MSPPNGGAPPVPPEPLSAQHILEYDYTRSLGPTLSAFFDGLREHRIVGAKTQDGRVIVPPTPHDPETGENIAELVDVGTSGVVTTWTWVTPSDVQPLGKPCAWALIQLDGADTGMLHVVDAGDESKMSIGMRVSAKFAAEAKGSILDLECFVPEGSS